ncbi:MAG: site-specific DNA-methyltransferase [Candidatus Metalachnospira sp.]|nr:site-specific DNA-methyltransferase [Candidatus Metalachnospira sp.]
MANFYETLIEVLKTDERFFTEDGTFLRNRVYESALNMEPGLLVLLLGNDETKKRFFADVNGMLVFDKVAFGWVINNRQFLPDSYTRFKNRIGLTDGSGELISASNDVVLSFPYKDCVLEGGQTKEDQKKDEVFFNETLAPNEVDRLLFPKAFSNARRYSTSGAQDGINFVETDNLIIKGNNLLVLSSLLKTFEGRIKCIYIDPPYFFNAKKDEDTFSYNSNFKLSTWLVFMKNRLEIARRLLSEDGAIFVQISDDGVAELHSLLKDIFCPRGENNFINKITVKTKSPSGFASVNPGVFETAEYILAFAKNKHRWTYNPQFVKSEFDQNYKWFVLNKSDDPSAWIIEDVFEYVAKQQRYESKKQATEQLGSSAFIDVVSEFALEHADSVFQSTAIGNNAGQAVVEMRDESKIQRDTVLSVKREGHYDVYIYNGREMAFYSKKIREIDGERVPSIQLSNIWMDTPYEGIAQEGAVTLKGGKKPEKLIRRIIEMSTNPGDIVLDYHLGSGTTCAVAHKIGRRYIGCEQLDYGDNDSLIRLNNVINGDSSGISKAVNWQGGGSFVYCELAKCNQKYIDEVSTARTDDELTALLERVMKSGFISSKVKPSDISDAASDFEALSVDDKKRFIIELLDKNMLYVNLCDLDDAEYAISDTDKTFTRSFYGLEEK